MRPVDAEATREIEEAVQKALTEAGMKATVRLVGRSLTLHGAGPPVEIDALYLMEQWPLLPGDLRERKATDVAARLIEAERAATAPTLGSPRGSSAPPRGSSAPPRYSPATVRPTGAPARGPKRPVVVPIGSLIVLLCAAGLAYFWFRSRPPSQPAQATSAVVKPETEDERRSRLCEAARTRVLTSGTLAQIDAEVWLAELWLATSKPGGDPAREKGVAELIEQGKLTATADPDLAGVPLGQVEIAGDEGAARGGSWRSLQIRFRGGYVSQFFDPAGRERLQRVAAKLADATGAELGALYGRCGHLRYHDIGAWFRGATPAHASAALVFSMGFSSERRLTNRDPSSPATTADLAPLVGAFGKVEKGAAEAIVRDAGGIYAPGVDAAPTVISFPLGGPTRAARATLELARRAGMGAP